MELKPLSSLYPELIVWEDISQCPETWASEDEIAHWLADVSDAHVDHVGFVIAEDDKNLILSDSYIESMGLFGNINKIPKAVIISRTRLT